MFEAVKRFFPAVVEGKIANMDSAGRAKLAEQCLLIGIKRADRANSRHPTYTVIDFGEGQKPEDFPATFLSLSERNKKGSHSYRASSTWEYRQPAFLHTIDIRLGHYKLVVSRRPGHDYWGDAHTHTRSRAGRHCQSPNTSLLTAKCSGFKAPVLSAFGHESLGRVSEGTIVRVYEFDVGGEPTKLISGCTTR